LNAWQTGGASGRRHPGRHQTDRFAGPYPMLENIIEDMTRVSQEFRRPTGMNMRI
jgi:hypothetical protein